VLAAVYYGAARLGLKLGFVEQVSAIWPPTGIALAAVLLYGYWSLPGIALGALLANVTAHEPLWTACAIAIGNMLEAFSAAWLLRTVAGFDPALGRLRDVLALVFLAAGLSTAVSATIGVTSLCLGHVQPWRDFASLWGVWWLGDAVGNLVVAPFLLTVSAFGRWEGNRFAALEACALFIGLAAVSAIVFGGPIMPISRDYPLEYALFPFVIWASLRFGTPMTTAVTAAISAIAIWGTLHGFGPLARWLSHESLVLLQVYMGVVAVTGLLLSAAIAERRSADRSLRRGLGLLEAITQGTTDAVFVKDHHGKYLMINSAGAQFLGRSVEQVLGKDDTQLFSADTAKSIIDRDQEVMESGQTMTYEESGAAAGMHRIYLSTMGPYRDYGGRVIGLIGISRDITERKKAEEDLREAARRKDEFLAMLAHELRNPLAPLRNAVAAMRVKGVQDPDLAWAVEAIERQVWLMTRLVDDLLDIGRISRGKIQLRKEPIVLDQVVARAAELCRPLIDQRCQTLTLSLSAPAVWLDADPVRLEQVIGNLLNNAAKYSPDGCRIVLRAYREKAEAVISVLDEGVGIARDQIATIFEPFAQAERSLNRAEGGLGIGLALVRRLVELHGGSVSCASAGPGKGSEFTIRLPALPAPANGARSQADAIASPPAATSRRILVVDDNDDSAQTMAMLLRYWGHEAWVANNGEAGLELARQHQPDCVLLDLGMPGMDGYEVGRRLKEDTSLKRTCIVAMTGWHQDEHRRRTRDAGFDHHLVKPVDPAALQALLAQIPSSANRYLPDA
jgi:PAS domain S-box-containing protein